MTIPDEAVQAAFDAYKIEDDRPSGIGLMRALEAALPFLTGVKVKALTWRETTHVTTDDDGGPLEGVPRKLNAWVSEHYKIIQQPGIHGLFILRGKSDGVGLVVSTIEAAKAAALADYEARILSEIEPAPSPRDELLKKIREGTAPGFINDGSNQEGNPDLDCPYCGGSGHKADVRSSPRTQALGEGVVNCAKNLLCSLDPENDLDNPEKFIAWHNLDDAIRALSSQPVADAPFQDRVKPWMLACFGEEISNDKLERCDRFIEEALELVQAIGYSADRAHALVDYVFNRDIGEPHQEVGGVMVTLAALCLASGLDMNKAGEDELARIWTKVEKIRAKQAAKPTGSALPIALPASPGASE